MEKLIISAGAELGLSFKGAGLGAQTICKNLSEYQIEKLDIYKDKDDIETYAKDKNNIEKINFFNQKLFELASKILKDGKMPVTVGGDHSIAIGSALASLKSNNNTGVIWLDAHTDYNTLATTVTGNIHGLPLAVIDGLCNEELAPFAKNFAKPENTVVVGARSVDDAEWGNIKNAGITVFSTEDIKQNGVEKIMQKAFDIALSGCDGVHISFDTDLIDPKVCPGVSVPESDGISERDAEEIIRFVKNRETFVRSFDLVEYNPLKDPDGATLKIVTKILKMFLD